MARPKREFTDKSQKAINKLGRMLYKDLVKAGEKPQDALTKAIKGILPLMR